VEGGVMQVHSLKDFAHERRVAVHLPTPCAISQLDVYCTLDCMKGEAELTSSASTVEIDRLRSHSRRRRLRSLARWRWRPPRRPRPLRPHGKKRCSVHSPTSKFSSNDAECTRAPPARAISALMAGKQDGGPTLSPPWHAPEEAPHTTTTAATTAHHFPFAERCKKRINSEGA